MTCSSTAISTRTIKLQQVTGQTLAGRKQPNGGWQERAHRAKSKTCHYPLPELGRVHETNPPRLPSFPGHGLHEQHRLSAMLDLASKITNVLVPDPGLLRTVAVVVQEGKAERSHRMYTGCNQKRSWSWYLRASGIITQSVVESSAITSGAHCHA